MIMRLLLFTFVAALAVAGDSFKGVCVGVVDGDTIDVLVDGRESVRVRLALIDSPEKKQPFCEASKKYMSSLVYMTTVRVDVVELDQYGRTVGDVSVGKTNVCEASVRAGMSWYNPAYGESSRLNRAMKAARKERGGLWVDPLPKPPWEFKREKKRRADAKNF